MAEQSAVIPTPLLVDARVALAMVRSAAANVGVRGSSRGSDSVRASTQKWDCQVIGWFEFQFFEDPP